jgi:hypothetical protein
MSRCAHDLPLIRPIDHCRPRDRILPRCHHVEILPRFRCDHLARFGLKDRFDPTHRPVPFNKYLERRNQEYHAGQFPCIPNDRPAMLSGPAPEPNPYVKLLEKQNEGYRTDVPRTERCRAPEPSIAPDRTDTSNPARWPRLGDVAPLPPGSPDPRVRIVYQLDLPLKLGRVIDLLL